MTPDKDEKKGLGVVAIIGIVIGSVAGGTVILAGAGVGVFSIVWFAVKKKSFADLKAILRRNNIK